MEGEEYIYNIGAPVKIYTETDNNGVLSLNGEIIEDKFSSSSSNSPFTIKSEKIGSYNVKIKLLGIIPIKSFDVKVLPNIEVVPCGNTVGVKLYTEGVLIIGTSKVLGIDGNDYYPWKQARIKEGDIIEYINNFKVENIEHLSFLIQQSGENTTNIKLDRKGEKINTSIHAIKSKEDSEYKLGLWVRDSTAGIGTLTFYQPKTGYFGGLGHGIADVDTGELLKVGHGSITRTNIVSIRKGKKGNPGELKGVFLNQYEEIGKIGQNCEFGIFGRLNNTSFANPNNKSMPVAMRSGVKEGKGYILSNISGDKVEKFEIEVQKVLKQKDMDSKGMIIKITDKRLLDETGGIVQGMSGSPIIQNGKLIGAVTHVFINDPTRGYGVFIDWMIKKSLSM
jgi:stage IV sporulation protein B